MMEIRDLKQEVFNFFSENHNLILLESEIEEIINLIENIKEYQKRKRELITIDYKKKKNYKCEFCKARENEIGYYNSNNSFVECDIFMINWARAKEKKIVKIKLKLTEDLKIACQKCYQNQKNQKNKKIENKIIDENKLKK